MLPCLTQRYLLQAHRDLLAKASPRACGFILPLFSCLLHPVAELISHHQLQWRRGAWYSTLRVFRNRFSRIFNMVAFRLARSWSCACPSSAFWLRFPSTCLRRNSPVLHLQQTVQL